MLPVTLCPQLVALIASPRYTPPHGTTDTRRPGSRTRTIWVLSVLDLGTTREMWIVDTNMLLEGMYSIL